MISAFSKSKFGTYSVLAYLAPYKAFELCELLRYVFPIYVTQLENDNRTQDWLETLFRLVIGVWSWIAGYLVVV